MEGRHLEVVNGFFADGYFSEFGEVFRFGAGEDFFVELVESVS